VTCDAVPNNTKIGGCHHTDYDNSLLTPACSDARQPYLTMPTEPNTLRIAAMDNHGNLFDQPLNVTASFRCLTGDSQQMTKAVQMVRAPTPDRSVAAAPTQEGPTKRGADGASLYRVTGSRGVYHLHVIIIMIRTLD
jgi:hypothetical protein